MTAKPIRATARQVRQLIDGTNGAPVGEHLVDEQFVAYSMDPQELGSEMLTQVEQHLLSCAECADRMEHLLAVSEAWRGPAGEQRLADVSRRIRDRFVDWTPPVVDVADAVSRLAGWLRQLPQCSAALGAVAGASLSEESPTRSEHLSIREDETGNLRIRLSSYDRALAGTSVVIEPFGRTLTLGPVAPDQVGAEAMIPASVRAELAPQTMVGWRIESEPRLGEK